MEASGSLFWRSRGEGALDLVGSSGGEVGCGSGDARGGCGRVLYAGARL